MRRKLTTAARIKTALFVGALLALSLSPTAMAKASNTKFPYTYVNPDGSKTIIPSEPKRVVTVVQAYLGLDLALSLGAPVVGSSSQSPGQTGITAQGFPAWINGGELNGITSIGASPDYEEIAALKPDLIITQSSYSPSELTQLEAIAPTVQENYTLQNQPNQFQWLPMLQQLAPIFNATARANAIIARFKQRTTALDPFVRGTTLAALFPISAQEFFVQTESYPLGGFFPGIEFEGGLPGGPPVPTGGNVEESSELLPEVTAQRVLVEIGTSFTAADFQALPLYSQIPAVKTGQLHFTDWSSTGPLGGADALVQLQKEVFGVSGFEASLAGAGKHGSSRSGIADVDFGPTNQRACWDISTSGRAGHLQVAVIVDRSGRKLLALGRGYHTTGCTTVPQAKVRALLAAHSHYRVELDGAHATKVLVGTLGPQLPGFFGNGRDKPFTQ